MASMSRWLVGSSMIRKSASSASISLMATRFTSPPESSPIFLSASGRRKEVSSSLSLWRNAALPSSWKPAVSRLLWASTCSSMLSPGEKS